MPPKEFTSYDLEVAQRLTALETTLQTVAVDVVEHRKVSEERSKDLTILLSGISDKIIGLESKISDSKFQWATIFNQQNIKIVSAVILALAGAGGFVEVILR
jgi:uncharacterized protein YfkK (UPF0435 family)